MHACLHVYTCVYCNSVCGHVHMCEWVHMCVCGCVNKIGSKTSYYIIKHVKKAC